MPVRQNKPRKSRTSTPYGAPTDSESPASDSRAEKPQSSLDGWVEPPPKNPEPSFQEHGFARHGVVEGMAALGVPPNARVKARTSMMPDAPTRRSVPDTRATSLAVAGSGVSTPEMTPAPEPETGDSAAPDDEDEEAISSAVPLPVDGEDEDDDYVPPKPKGKAAGGKTPVRGKGATQNTTPSATQTPVRNGNTTLPSRPSTATRPHNTVRLPPVNDLPARQRMQIAINDAERRARDAERLHVGQALQEILKWTETDAMQWEILFRVMHNDHSPDQLKIFRQAIRDTKRKIRQYQKQARKDSVPSSTPQSPAAAASTPAKATNRVPALNSAGPAGASPGGPTPTLPSSIQDDIAMEDVSSAHDGGALAPGSERPAPHPLGTVPDLAKRSPSPRPHRMPSKSPRKRALMNDAAKSDGNAGVNGESYEKVPSPDAESPDSIIGAGSDSDLSDVNEDIVQQGPPEPLQPQSGSATPAPAEPRKKKGAPVRNAGNKSRTNSVKPNGKHEKKLPPTAEELAEQEEVKLRREQLSREQPYLNLQDFPESTSRFEDELMETESLTSSQIAVGPPVSFTQRHAHARRSGNINVPKRFRDDDSPALPSPFFSSSRPTTPVIAPPPSKRVKLTNGQTARTKRSPIKNRNGPIAGIPHGGAARQLGPDDNDPESPLSESDDFCSACKGAGEFVCCDHCTRVYHYLCCDPPRQAAPEGSFSCFECDAKLRAAEPSPVDTFVPFGPLLKQLEATNTQSFCLPFDVRDFFEGVSSQKDGSYVEEVKKVALARSSGYGYMGPKYFDTHDEKGKIVLCIQCGKSTTGKRQMLKCDYCSAYWHLDCCDPPLANPPYVSQESGKRDAWKCPRHVDHDFGKGIVLQHDLNAIAEGDVSMVDASYPQLVTRKVRKPKRAKLVEPTFSRGLHNNGLIEVIHDSGDETDGEGNYVLHDDLNSKIFRLPEKGIVLDFLSKVKESRMQERKQQRAMERRAAKAAKQRAASRQQFASRSLPDQQAALYLAQLANKEKDIGLDQTTVDALCLGLTAEAPKEVVTAIEHQGPGPLTEDKKKGLLKLKELIEKALKDEDAMAE